MSDDWEEFKRLHESPFKSLIPKVKITIYGSYFPKKEKALLIELKRILIDEGYLRAALVEDRQMEGQDPFEASKLSLLFSDLNILLFTKPGKRFGVVSELDFLASDPHMIQKIPFSLIFDKGAGEQTSIPPLSRGLVKGNDIRRRSFKNYSELKKIFIYEIFLMLKKWARWNAHVT